MSSISRSPSVSSVRSRSRSIIDSITARPLSRSNSRARSVDRSGRFGRSSSRSRTASPGRLPQRLARASMHRSRSAVSSIDHHHTPNGGAIFPRTHGVRRWDGNGRTTTKWDSIRRDPELWFPNGDCLIHFYERGTSRRGPSLRVSVEDIETSNCGPLLARYLSEADPSLLPSSPSLLGDHELSEYFHDRSPPAKYELYIPAPTELGRDDAFMYHLATRNFFAWMFEKPLVGERLGQALTALLDRMDEYRPDPEANKDDMLAYIDEQGYTDFRDCPDHALSALQFAEKFQFRDLWTDAFVHCVGMNERLDSSAEFDRISRASQALITRAHIEMQVRLERSGRSLEDFLEDELPGSCPSLGKDAHTHLERFRTFLHAYYIGRYSYWPPAQGMDGGSAFPQSVYRSLYFDFRHLYDYLVDSTSDLSLQDIRSFGGGLSVFQNVVSFDKKNKYSALPHPLPLLPKMTVPLKSRRSLSRLHFFTSRQAKVDRKVASAGALAAATNRNDPQVMDSALVREYLQFEKTWTMKEDHGVGCAEARKVRWLLVYAILQTLISVTRIPSEVRDTEGVLYPLCCQTAGTPPWTVGPRRPNTHRRPQPQLKRMSLRDRILANKPDVNLESVAPGPLVIPKRRQQTSTPTAPQTISFANRLSLRAPQPIRTKSWEILSSEFPGSETPAITVTTNEASSIVPTPVPFPQPSPLTPSTDTFFSHSRPLVSPLTPTALGAAARDCGDADPGTPTTVATTPSDRVFSGSSGSSQGSPTTPTSSSAHSYADDEDSESSCRNSRDEGVRLPTHKTQQSVLSSPAGFSDSDASDYSDVPKPPLRHRSLARKGGVSIGAAAAAAAAAAPAPMVPTKSAKRLSFAGGSGNVGLDLSLSGMSEKTVTPVTTIVLVEDDREEEEHRTGVNRELEAYLSS